MFNRMPARQARFSPAKPPVRTFVRPKPAARRGFPPVVRRGRRFPSIRPYFYEGATIPAGSDYLRSIQEDLARVLNMAVPITGVLDAATRRAVRILQSRFGLPVTGRMDVATIRVLRQTASTPFAREPHSTFDDSAPPEGSHWISPDAGATEAPPPEEDPGPAPEDVPGDPEEGFITLSGNGAVTLKLHQPSLALSEFESAPLLASQLPKLPGLYVISDRNGPWYVGIASKSIHGRFLDRLKSLHDLKVRFSDLKLLFRESGRKIHCYTVVGTPVFPATRGPSPSKAGAVELALRAVEQEFIKRLNTRGKGNQDAAEPIHYGPRKQFKMEVTVQVGGRSTKMVFQP